MSGLFAYRSWAISKYLSTINTHRTFIGNYVHLQTCGQHEHETCRIQATLNLPTTQTHAQVLGAVAVQRHFLRCVRKGKVCVQLCAVKVFCHQQMHQIACISLLRHVSGAVQAFRIGQSRQTLLSVPPSRQPSRPRRCNRAKLICSGLMGSHAQRLSEPKSLITLLPSPAFQRGKEHIQHKISA